ncbi:hypothetical protein KAJ89_04170 [Candidatus Parcubacteria bacterium]|nr:hypothetical protein [Candidatus Parcubacteria bacterium]
MNRQYKIGSAAPIICKDCLYPLGELSLVIFDGLDANRKNELNFHAGQDDYFGTLATVLNNLAQRGGDTITQRKKLLSELRDDLEYMQDNYRLVQK